MVAQYIHGSGLGADVGSLLIKEAVIDNAVHTSYYYTNHRGDVTAIADDIGALIASYRYDAFGNVIEQSGTAENELQFSSKRYNSDISLSYFGARYYDPLTGRFISRDPMEYIDGPNMYIYVRNNPLQYIDPFGYTARQAKDDNGFTFQIGVSATGGLAGGGTGGGGLILGYSKNNGLQIGFYETFGGGPFIGEGKTITGDITVSGNDDINDLSGFAISSGGSGGVLIVGGSEINIATNNNAKPSLTFSGGAGQGLETHAFGTLTLIQEVISIKFGRDEK